MPGENGSFLPGKEVSEINTTGSESGATISPDGKYIVFSAYGREDGYGGEDIYPAKRQGNRWGVPLNLGPVVNSAAEEAGAHFSPDGQYFYFSRSTEKGQADIYYVSVSWLGLPR